MTETSAPATEIRSNSGEQDRMSDTAVQRATGKTWPEWFAILDAAGCREKDHKGIVAVLDAQYPDLSGWWQQGIAVAYEKAMGLRVKYQRNASEFASSASKTINASPEAIFEAWTDPERRAAWLPDPAITIRTARPGKSVRALWVDGTSTLAVEFYVQGPAKTRLSVEHDKLSDREAAVRTKTYWSAALDRLKTLVE